MTRSHPAPRGFTLIENMAALGILLVGGLGLLGLFSLGERVNGDARRMTRATAVAQDLLGQIQTWPYTDTRLGPGSRTGTDLADDAMAFEGDSPVADHSDADLAVGWGGVEAATLGGEYERYWNVAYTDDSNANGIADGVRVAVIVRWRHGGGWRRIVLTGFKPNPQER